MRWNPLFVVVTAICVLIARPVLAAEIALELRTQAPVPGSPGGSERRVERETWNAAETAVIVCDVWDLHHCHNAVRRLEEFVPRLNEVLIGARARGAIVIHAPSDCMEAYASHPDVWLNGHQLKAERAAPATLRIPPATIRVDDANLLVVRVLHPSSSQTFPAPHIQGRDYLLQLAGRWQFRLGDDPSWSNIPLPARFGTAPDILFEPPSAADLAPGR